MKKVIKNYSASVRSRIENVAKENHRGFSEILLFYTMERFLFRLSQISEGSSFILKGGIMFRIWDKEIPRPTRDIDLLSNKTNDIHELSRIMAQACTVSCEEDGVEFSPQSIRAEKIKEDADYEGVRIKIEGKLGTARTPLQIDIGFGDVVVPNAILIEYPTIIDLPAPKLKTYSKESVIAEKIHAMVFLGSMNSRMKDFYDIWFLVNQFDFESNIISEAIAQTFKRRKTNIDPKPIAFSLDFAKNQQKQIQWKAFYRKLQTDHQIKELDFVDVVKLIKKFSTPILEAVKAKETSTGKWDHAKKKWSS